MPYIGTAAACLHDSARREEGDCCVRGAKAWGHHNETPPLWTPTNNECGRRRGAHPEVAPRRFDAPNDARPPRFVEEVELRRQRDEKRCEWTRGRDDLKAQAGAGLAGRQPP